MLRVFLVFFKNLDVIKNKFNVVIKILRYEIKWYEGYMRNNLLEFWKLLLGI